MKPSNAPPLCPRGADESNGPRRCRFTSCPNHLRHKDGPRENAERRELARALPDTCTVDLSERVRTSVLRGAKGLRLTEVAVILGTDPASVYRSEQRALQKLRKLRVHLRVLRDGR